MPFKIENVIKIYEESLQEISHLVQSGGSQEEILQKINDTLNLRKEVMTDEDITIVNRNRNQDALRYNCVANGIFMSDGRPFIVKPIYQNGRFVEHKPLTREEANQLIDPLL